MRKPSFFCRRSALSGVAATRRSPAESSLGIPSVITGGGGAAEAADWGREESLIIFAALNEYTAKKISGKSFLHLAHKSTNLDHDALCRTLAAKNECLCF